MYGLIPVFVIAFIILTISIIALVPEIQRVNYSLGIAQTLIEIGDNCISDPFILADITTLKSQVETNECGIKFGSHSHTMCNLNNLQLYMVMRFIAIVFVLICKLVLLP